MWFLHPRDIDVLKSLLGGEFKSYPRRDKGGNLRSSLPMYGLPSDYRSDCSPKETKKHQIPSTKFQIDSNGRNSKFETGLSGSLDIGFWDLFGIWDLEFGISL